MLGRPIGQLSPIFRAGVGAAGAVGLYRGDPKDPDSVGGREP